MRDNPWYAAGPDAREETKSSLQSHKAILMGMIAVVKGELEQERKGSAAWWVYEDLITGLDNLIDDSIDPPLAAIEQAEQDRTAA